MQGKENASVLDLISASNESLKKAKLQQQKCENLLKRKERTDKLKAVLSQSNTSTASAIDTSNFQSNNNQFITLSGSSDANFNDISTIPTQQIVFLSNGEFTHTDIIQSS